MDTMNMEGMGWMMGGMGLLAVLVLIFLVLGIAAFIKYLFFDKRDQNSHSNGR